MPKDKERIAWIDQLRSIAFLFVIIGHVALPKEMQSLIYSFHMPLFFLISGLTINREKLISIPLKDYILKQFKGLVIPYFWMSYLCYPLWYVTFKMIDNVNTSVFDVFKGIFIGNNLIVSSTSNALWFLLVLFIANILYVCLLKITKGYNFALLGLVLICAVFGYLDKGFAQVWHFNVAFTAIVMIFIGNEFMMWYKKSNFFKRKHDVKYTALIIGLIMLFFLIGIISHIINGRISMTANKFGKSFLLFYITALAFSAVITLIVMHLPKISLITCIGRNTLLYVGIHIPIIRLLEHAFNDIFSQYKFSIPLAFVLYVGLLPVVIFCQKFVPFVCGKTSNGSLIYQKIARVLIVMWCAAVPYYYLLLKFGFTVHDILFDTISIAALAVLSYVFVLITSKYLPIMYLENKQNRGAVNQSSVNI